MLTDINIANALATVAAEVDGNVVTQNNAIFATGYSTGSAILNFGSPVVIDGFAASGSIAYDTANNRFQAANGAYFTFVRSDVNANIALVSQGTTGGTLDLNGAGLSFTPDAGDGTLGVAVTKDGATFSAALDGTGTITFSAAGGVPVITVPKDFSLNVAATTYTGIPIAGNIHGDGINDVYATLVNGTQILFASNGAVGANLNLGGIPFNNVTLSGAIVLDPLRNSLTFSQGSSLGIDFGTRHVSFTATDNTGGQLIFGANGLTFNTPGGDGGLILSVTENGVTRQTLLNVAGTINYSLNGSITLGAGTVVHNVFADGNVLTITALTDASGSIFFDPQNGLFITPSTPDALNVVLSTGDLDVVNISSITGTINYTGGVITAGDGTAISMTDYEGYNSVLSISGGTASVRFGTDRAVYTANQGAIVIANWLDGKTWQVYNGTTLTDTYNGYAILSEGATFNSNDDLIVEILEKAGNYTLNGMNVTTTSDNVQVLLANYNTVVVGDFAYTPLNGYASLAISNAGVVGMNEAVLVSPISSLVASADLAGDFLPNYDNDFANALQLTDAGTFDNQLSEILPVNADLGEMSFDTQPDKLTKQQIIIAMTDKRLNDLKRISCRVQDFFFASWKFNRDFRNSISGRSRSAFT